MIDKHKHKHKDFCIPIAYNVEFWANKRRVQRDVLWCRKCGAFVQTPSGSKRVPSESKWVVPTPQIRIASSSSNDLGEIEHTYFVPDVIEKLANVVRDGSK